MPIQPTMVVQNYGQQDKRINMKWLFKEKNCTEKDINRIETKFDVALPKEYIEVVLQFNGAYPEFNTYDTDTQKGKIVQALLSCLDEPMNVDEITNLINLRGVVAFLSDPFGNYICFQYFLDKSYNIILWNHEDKSIEIVSDSFVDFLNKLY